MDSTQLDLSVVESTGLHRGCGMKHVPRSAAAHGSMRSVPPSSKVKRTSGSAATQKVQMSAPVCRSHPGKVLELRTSLGLSRARAILEQQPREMSITEADLGVGQRGRGSTRGQLKSARLQPLMGAADPVLDPDSCLGIVPATVMRDYPSNKDRKPRPRSSTVPGLHLDEQTPRGWSDSNRVRVKRRSYSAIAARTVDTEKLLQLFSVTRSTGLVPQRLPESDHESANAADHSPTHGQTLPPVVPHLQLGEPGIKVEVKGLKKAQSHSPQSRSPRDSPKKSSDAPGDLKLPLIANSPSLQKSSSDSNTHKPEGSPFRSSDTKQKATQMDSSLESAFHSESPINSPVAANCTSTGSSSTSTSDGGIMRVSIVSLGEAGVAEEKSRGRNQRRKRQSSGKQSGRLSLGWSPPQPIEPLKGNPLLISPNEVMPKKSQNKTRGVDGYADENGTGLLRPTSAVSSRPMSAASSNILSVNVSEFLQDDTDPQVQY